MRRIVIGLAAMLSVLATGSALAAGTATTPSSSTNNGASVSYSATGGTKKNVGVTLTETLGTLAPTGFGRPFPLANLQTKVAGLSSPYAKYFPKCTVAMINNAGASGQWNGVCPKGSEVAQGTLVAAIGDSTSGDGTTPDPHLTATPLVNPCNLGLHVYNAGPGKLAFFFTVASNACGPLSTGAALAYSGTAYVKGGYLYNNVPEDANISFNAGGTGDWGSLLSEHLVWKASVKHKGKTYPYLVSKGCKGTRKYGVTFTPTTATGNASTAPTTIPPSSTDLPNVSAAGSSKC